MKYDTALILLAFFGLSSAAPVRESKSTVIPRYQIQGREVPQEHSHNKFLASVRKTLALNNPDQIADPVFGLLGNAAAAAGAGKITNLDCLHQATADQAFTNAKAAKDVNGMVDALVFQALERNTGSVGLKSVLCTAIPAKNPEIAAISQHQDPASAGAAAANKAITLELAKQIASVGGDPLIALQSGTFTPGKIGDPTGAGNTCDTADDTEGCIFTQKLLVEDATAAEIAAAVAGVSAGAGNAAATTVAGKAAATAPAGNVAATTVAAQAATTAVASACPVQVTSTVVVEAPAVTAAAKDAAAAVVSACPAAVTMTVTVTGAAAAATGTAAATAGGATTTGTNVQTFTGTLGGAAAPIQKIAGNRPFQVNGNTFVNAGAALQRSCDIQNNSCFNAVNSGQLTGGTAQCSQQQTACLATVIN